MNMGVHESPVPASVEWYTPPSIFKRLGLEFDLDPASPIGGVPWIPAARHLTRLDDGLTTPWDGFVWLNPPYGRELIPFVDRMVEHEGGGIMLLASRTETVAFQRAARAADVVAFHRGRIRFVSGSGKESAPSHGSAFFAFGARAAEALVAANFGWTVR